MGCDISTHHSRSSSPSSRHFKEQDVPSSFLSIFESCAECKNTMPMPRSALSATLAISSSDTAPWYQCPHQNITSVAARMSSVSPSAPFSSARTSVTALPSSSSSCLRQTPIPSG